MLRHVTALSSKKRNRKRMDAPLRAHKRDLETIWNRRWRLEHLYPIRTEDRKLRYLNMKERPIQEALFEKAEKNGHRGIRIINLKSRKLGVSTFWLLYYLDDTLWTPNTTSGIIAHTKEDVQKLFQIVKTAYARAPKSVRMHNGKDWRKPEAKYDNKNELVFDGLNSKIYVALQSRGETNQNLHVSEAAHIAKAEERMAATLESVPNRDLGSNITVESTAYGVGGWFHDAWYDAETHASEYDGVFFSWFEVAKNRVTPPPDFHMTAEEQELVRRVKERYGVALEPSQVFWWRQKKTKLKRLMNQEHPTFPDDAFMSSGMMVFDEDAIKQIKTKEPIRTLQDGTRIFVEPKPGRRYVVAGDVAEGGGGDRSVAEVVDCVTLEQVAEFVSDSVPPAEFAEILARLGRMYNMAIVAPERNNHGHTTIERLRHIYSRVFAMYSFDERRNKKTKKLGWLTNGHTRDLILDTLEELTEDGTIKVNSAILKSEMLTFVTNPDGKREAKSGYHDDTIMALAIAVKIATMPRSSYGVYEIT